ncbi:MAG TPA: integrase arm-type DNA-binding domain-containing protein [Nitrococcus sp.]|nr:integrase arm-type DNA-binding domain-containing protein [Nitrococcus sp.]
MPLTDTAARKAKPTDKPRKLADSGGLYLLVAPNGGRYWRLDYRHGRKRKTLALGVYPDTGLKTARERRDEARKLLADGVDPGAQRKAQKTASVERAANSFEVIAREWYAKYSPSWTPDYGKHTLGRLERDVFPYLGGRPIAEITAPELLMVARRIEERGALESAHRAIRGCGQVFRYAVATGRAERDPSGDLRGALPPVRVRHHPSITDTKRIGELLRAIRGYQGSPVTRAALHLAPLVFVRPGELCRAEWAEIDLDGAEWRLPPAKMKMRALHIVPLSTQAVAILRELHPLTGHERYVFPGARDRSRHMSPNTIGAALGNLGYGKDEMTAHGFRSMASTLLNEQGWLRDAIERQLAHSERDGSRAAYNYAEHLPERRKMMQAWANSLDALAAGAKVVPIGTVVSEPCSA